jgi:hypothetical protein
MAAPESLSGGSVMSVAFILFSLAAAQGGMISNSSPPQVVTVTPPIISPRIRDVSPEAIVAVPIHVRVAAGNQVLFEDTLRAARNSSASFEQSRSEAPAGPCPANRGYGYGGNRESLRVQVYVVDSGPSGPSARVTVNWQRPSDTAGCNPEGSRTVAISETVPLQPGQTATIRGDGGLVVTLSRR